MVLPVISVVDVINYGTMLQSYALQRVLTDMGYDVKIIHYPHRELGRQLSRIFDLELVRVKWKILCKRAVVKRNAEIAEYDEKKNLAFRLFREESLTLSEELSNRKELIRYVSGKTAVVLGSDQVWNPVNLGRDYYTMSFVPRQVRKVAYAPSFGVNSIPRKQRRRTKKYLERIECLSAREASGAGIIRELTNREAKVVCDPTLLLESTVWELEERKVDGIPERYIFCYFLGNSPENRKFANDLREKTQCEIVHLPFMDEFVESDGRFGDVIPQGIGPREFLFLVRHAAYVCTDSFHGTVFSLLFHRPFFAMPRAETEGKGSTSGRITDLLNMVHLEDCFIKSPDKNGAAFLKKERVICWDAVEEDLKSRRKESLDYLIKSLKEQNHGDDRES